MLELRQQGARGSVRKFDRILHFADAGDDRMRGTMRYLGRRTWPLEPAADLSCRT